MRRKFWILCVFVVMQMVSDVQAKQQVYIVPNPQEITFNEGSFNLQEAINVEAYLNDKKEEAFIFDQLKSEFQQSVDRSILFRTGQEGSQIVIGIKGGSRKFDQLIRKNNLEPGKELGEEGYRLLVTTDLILISANSLKGTFYGVQSLKQLIRGERLNGAIPGMEIKDWPDMKIRGMMDDISRGPVPTLAFMKEQIERMAEMKVNMLTYYTQDVVKTESHPAFAPPGGALSIEEWRELDAYADTFHIDLVGNFQSFGHFENILKHPEYAHLGEAETLLSPAFKESYELLEDIYAEMIPAFNSEYFHINSDETFDLGSGASKAMVDSLGEAVVYVNHIKRIHKIITGMGKKVMMWGDIVLKHPETLDMLPKDIIMVTWNYDDLDDFSPLIQPFADSEFEFFVSTGVLNSHTIFPDFNKAKGNIDGFITDAIRNNSAGMLHTIWDDGGFALFSRDWYGVTYAAEQSWHNNPGDPSYESRFNRAIYGSTGNGITDAINTLNELAALKSTEKMNVDILWDKAIPEQGGSLLMNVQDWPKVLNLIDQAEQALTLSEYLIHTDDVKYIEHTIELYKYLANSRLRLVAASKMYEQATILQVQNPKESRKELIKAFELISENHQELDQIKNEYEYLWLLENRAYALDRIVTQFESQLLDLKEVRDSLLASIYDLDKNQILPDPQNTRLDIQESDGWYFQGWLMIDPIPNPEGAGNLNIDHLEETGGISKTFPNVTEEFYFNGDKYRWRRVNTPYFAKVDLDELHDQSEDVVMYAFAHIDAPDNRTVRALAGSSDGIEVFINGEQVHQNFEERDFKPDEDELFLPLHEGRNHLMIRITNHTGDWAFSFRLPDSEMRSRKNRYRIID